ncbi:hypothetical protein M9Y10_030184 [Tritrichomonas musculus]|uniref:Uncharacterized protein n=1 Tax=Tritrichomonas musculus TaxID=1915356 RepID=A0ABR2KPU5_9EUKA
MNNNNEKKQQFVQPINFNDIILNNNEPISPKSNCGQSPQDQSHHTILIYNANQNLKKIVKKEEKLSHSSLLSENLKLKHGENMANSSVKSLPQTRKARYKKEVKTRKNIYGKGLEFERLKKLPHFNQPYQNIEMFLRLGKPNKFTINLLGEKYNLQFANEIKELKLPLFGRDQKRNKSLAIWFFEDHKNVIIPWLRSIMEI